MPSGQKPDPPDYAQETRIVDLGEPDVPRPGADVSQSGDAIPRAIRVQFRSAAGPSRGEVYEMRKPIVILGRVAGVADVVIEDALASRHHASVAHKDGKFVLSDMGSTNGTYVNQKRVVTVELLSGDQIRVGATVLVFEVAPRD
ncbi:MAG: FHA domain-containing protein [Deltaproteobacteria bacterium]|nr:FHA domain-containing protein [Deltaproteobacteria bacterium]